tara:strand:+ start:467 stop:739 length:273 start_codon:yes stop_codon:yes gene_type:complete
MDVKIKKIYKRVPGSQKSKEPYTNRVVIFQDIAGKEWICNVDSRADQSNYIENNLTKNACFTGFIKQSETHIKLRSPIKCIYNPQTKLAL